MAMKASLVATLLVACVLCFASLSDAKKKLRVRKELRTLSNKEKEMYVRALAVMLSIPTEAGKRIYGPKYKEMDYFIVKHMVAAQIPFNNAALGNVGHFGPHFMSFHRAFALEWENSILSIVPELGAAPYWEPIYDLAGGKYYETDQWMYGPNWAGNKTGDPDMGYGVMDGLFGGRQVKKFNKKKYGYVAHINSGNVHGYLRSPDNSLDNPWVTRFPSENLMKLPKPWPVGLLGDYGHYYEIGAGLKFNYSHAEAERCVDPDYVTNIWDFIMCIEFPASLLSGLPANVTKKWLYDSNTSPWTHPMFHSITGSLDIINTTNATNVLIQGDARDLGSSPNEVMMFMPDHINLDRMFLRWQQEILKKNPKMKDPEIMYGFPKNYTGNGREFPPVRRPDQPRVLKGTTLYDNMLPEMPFTDIFDYPTPRGVTHEDILNWKLTYKYDTMEM